MTEPTPSDSPPTPAKSAPSKAGRLWRWAPALVGLALAALGLAAVGFAQSGLEIHVQPGTAPTDAPDPTALLRDDVATLQADLGALSKGIGTNLEALATALDGAAEERHAEQLARSKALSKRLTRLEAALAAETRESARLRAELASLTGALAKGTALASARPAPFSPDETDPKPRPQAKTPEPVKAADPPPIAAKPEPDPAPAPRKRRRGLFSFKLAGGGPDFTQRQRYRVISSLSRVGFDAKSTLHDFSGVTSTVEGSFVSRFDVDDTQAKGKIRAAVKDLRTGVDGRDEEMRKLLGAKRHPWIEFQLTSLEITKSDPQARTATAIGKGTFTIHGTSHEVSVPLAISVDRSKRLLIAGETKLSLLDYKVEVPDMGAIGMKPDVKIWLSLRLRSLGKAGK
ncbi:MAG: YceI family protein [Planctomycetes bacterium]|nr:YceI family protein [Planctomycetota bacterium]